MTVPLNYVIAVGDLEQSVQAAKRCVQSGLKHGLLIEIFDAVTPRNTDLQEMCDKENINVDGFNEVYSRFDNCVAAFLSHYSIWKKAVETNTTHTIFEHDAVVIDQLNSNIPFDKVTTFGKPSYGKYNTPNFLGTGPLTQKPYFGGAHAYRVSPTGAELLIAQAKIEAKPTDVFLHVNTFPWLQETYPWKAEVRESFSTIQNERGCLAKHMYGEGYELI